MASVVASAFQSAASPPTLIAEALDAAQRRSCIHRMSVKVHSHGDGDSPFWQFQAARSQIAMLADSASAGMAACAQGAFGGLDFWEPGGTASADVLSASESAPRRPSFPRIRRQVRRSLRMKRLSRFCTSLMRYSLSHPSTSPYRMRNWRRSAGVQARRSSPPVTATA